MSDSKPILGQLPRIRILGSHTRIGFITHCFVPCLSLALLCMGIYTYNFPDHKSSLGSLTLGGSDLSRYTPSNISFDFAPDISADLVVGLQKITATYGTGATQPLLTSPILTYIDSTLPYIYLPAGVCEMFEKEFGLVWNSTANFYPVDDVLHKRLLADDLVFNFTVGNNESSAEVIDITLPYASFDLTAKPPLLPNITSYFPLRRAANKGQYILGRTFLQDALSETFSDVLATYS